jgi:hypothetical protein
MTPPPPPGTGLSNLLVVWDEECLRHDPGGEVWLGQGGYDLTTLGDFAVAALRGATG